MNDNSTNLIYGLVDPRTLLIRYVGLSSRGLARPNEHRNPSCPDSYCRRWVRSLERQGLTYEITVLAILEDPTRLDEAECWWIAYGRASGWPLTNLANGGKISKERILKWQRKKAAQEAAELTEIRWRRNLQSFYAPQDYRAFQRYLKIPAAIEKQCFEFFDVYFSPRRHRKMIDEAVRDLCVTRDTATLLYNQWLSRNPERRITVTTCIPAEIERRCFQFLDEQFTIAFRDRLIDDIIAGVCVTRDTATRVYTRWLQRDPAPAAIRDYCFQHFTLGKPPAEVIAVLTELKLIPVPETIENIYEQWAHESHARGKRALEKDRQELFARLSTEKAYS